MIKSTPSQSVSMTSQLNSPEVPSSSTSNVGNSPKAPSSSDPSFNVIKPNPKARDTRGTARLLFPASKLMDMIIGIDLHKVTGPWVHPYFGPVYLWHSPKFPSANVLINNMPATTVGAMGYFAHIPQGGPIPDEPTNIPYWTRYLSNIPMILGLVALTMLANIAIAAISAAFVSKENEATKNFIRDVTGIDSSNTKSIFDSIKTNLTVYTQWQTWIRLLLPPLPFPGSNGSIAVGSPSVMVNSAPLAIVSPLVAASCSTIPIVPNAMTSGFSNVLVGVSITDLLRGIAVSAAQGAVMEGVGKSMNKGMQKINSSKQKSRQGNKSCGCG